MAKAMGNCDIFVASEIFPVLQSVGEFYRRMRNTCRKSERPVFLPIDYAPKDGLGLIARPKPQYVKTHPTVIGMTRDQAGTYQTLMTLSLNQVNVAKLGVFYFGHRSTIQGEMLGRAKMNGLPIIVMYEKFKERQIKEEDPLALLEPKSKKDVARIAAARQLPGANLGSEELSFHTGRRYHGIRDEIVFETVDEGFERLERAVEGFFSDN